MNFSRSGRDVASNYCHLSDALMRTSSIESLEQGRCRCTICSALPVTRLQDFEALAHNRRTHKAEFYVRQFPASRLASRMRWMAPPVSAVAKTAYLARPNALPPALGKRSNLSLGALSTRIATTGSRFLSPKALNRWEKGETPLPDWAIVDLARVLKVIEEELLHCPRVVSPRLPVNVSGANTGLVIRCRAVRCRPVHQTHRT
jgi:hypothetical protein